MADEIIFTSIHGSRLYNLDHEGSDRDSIIVYNDNRRALHQKINGEDVITVGLTSLLDQAFTGSPQFVEAVFSHKKEWYDESWRAMFESFRMPVAAVRVKYRARIHAFIRTDTQKSRQHAVRFAITLRDLRRNNGWYDPTLTDEDRAYVQATALTYRDEELLQQIEEIIYE